MGKRQRMKHQAVIVLSADVSETEILAFTLGEDANWTKDVGSLDPQLIKKSVLLRGEVVEAPM